MTAEEARTRLASMTAADADPVLTSEELDDLLAANRIIDAEGRSPEEEGWTAGWAFGAAAEDGWLRKAGKVAARVDGGSGGLTLARSQLHAHCLAMAERYSMRRSASMPLAAPAYRSGALPVFNRNDPDAPDPLDPGVGGAL